MLLSAKIIHKEIARKKAAYEAEMAELTRKEKEAAEKEEEAAHNTEAARLAVRGTPYKLLRTFAHTSEHLRTAAPISTKGALAQTRRTLRKQGAPCANKAHFAPTITKPSDSHSWLNTDTNYHSWPDADSVID